MLAIHAYHDNYVLPYYYTSSPDQAVYAGTTPEGQQVMGSEFKGQLSLYVPIAQWDRFSLNAAYTQKSFWQMYAKSQWFRETNYNPQIFLTYNFNKNLSLDVGLDHESNGRGADMERSWNRAFTTVNYKVSNFTLESEIWYVVTKNEALDPREPGVQMEEYLGNEKITAGYEMGNFLTKLSIENIEHPNHTSFTVSEAYKISDDLAVYGQYFYGYGQSLIEYNHLTQGVGIGFKIL